VFALFSVASFVAHFVLLCTADDHPQFNVNHFIVSQANPHAVLFASYSHRNNAWTNPLASVVYSVLKFLKDQVRSWLNHAVECISAGRFTSRHEGIVSTQFFTQEYEGRSTDVSLIPWLGHRGLFSALLHIIYNPSAAEFLEWVQAAERETWSFIPRIKSHIAEEVTLDRCVQRLRRRLVEESWQKQVSKSAGDKMGERVPSFFTSPSLLNLGGLGIADQPSYSNILPPRSPSSKDATSPVVVVENGSVLNGPVMPLPLPFPKVDSMSGWNGLGLRGNRSSGNLHRSLSDASGLFIDEEHAAMNTSGEDNKHQQHETSENVTSTLVIDSGFPELKKKLSDPAFSRYVKTSSMAKFYYRRTREYSEDGEEAMLRPPPAAEAALLPLSHERTGSIRKATSDIFVTSGGSSVVRTALQSGDGKLSSTEVTPRIRHSGRKKSSSFNTLATTTFVETDREDDENDA
jgi:hypothetical protein